MLKKLFKYEWRAVSTLLFILHGALLVYSLVGRLGYQLLFGSFSALNTLTQAQELMIGIYFMIYVFGILAVAFVTYIYLAVRIQKNLFSDEGYLTNTLPVTPNSLIWSKVFIFWLWTAIDFIVIILSLLILLLNGQSMPSFADMMSQMWSAFLDIRSVTDILDRILLIALFVTQYLCCFTGLLLFSICLGSLFNVHKVLGAVVSFFGISIVYSVFNMLLLFFTGFSTGTVNAVSGRGQVIFCCIFYLVSGLLFYLGSKFTLTRKLNLA